MRWFFSIIAVYIFSLAIVPCADGITNHSHQHRFAVHADGDADAADEGDHCTPFCACDCCRLPVVSQEAAVEESTPAQYFKITHIELVERPFTDFYFSVWRPPIA